MRTAVLLAVLLFTLGSLLLLGVFDASIPAELDPLVELEETPETGPALAASGAAAAPRAVGAKVDGANLLKRLQALDPEAAGRLLLSLFVGPDPQTINGPPALVAYLIEALASPNRVLSGGAQNALGKTRPLPYAAVQPLLTHAAVALRMKGLGIFSAWARAGEPFDDPGWIGLFKDSNAQVAFYAWSVVCGGVPYSEALADDCVERLPSHEGGHYRGPGQVLAGMGPRGVSRLFDLLEQPESSLVFETLGSLRFVKTGALREFFARLEPWLRTANEDHQVLVLEALNNQGPVVAELMPALLEAWEHESFSVRLGLLGVFERLGPKAMGAAEVLLAVIDEDFDERITSRAMDLLGDMRALPTKVLPRLRTALDEGGDDNAARAIGAYGPAAAPYLRTALESPNEDVRYFALAGVYRMGKSGASLRDLVLPLITIDDEEMAARAAAAAGQMGEAASEAVPDLWGRAQDGFLKPAAVGGVFHGIGRAASSYLLARLQGTAGDARLALAVLGGYPNATEFALNALGPFLAAQDALSRRTATLIVAAALRPSGAGAGEAYYAAVRTHVVPAPMRARLSALLTPRKGDQDRFTRGIALQALARLEEMAARERTRTGR